MANGIASQHRQVIIIGGGACGIYASHYLTHRLGVKSHMILEANSHLGGRIKQGLANSKRPHTEIGAEFVHGDDSILNELVAHLGIPLEFAFDLTNLEDPVKNGALFYHNGKLVDCTHPMVANLIKTLEDMEEFESDEDMSVQQYLNKTFPDPNENREMSQLVDCYMVKTDGSNLDLNTLLFSSIMNQSDQEPEYVATGFSTACRADYPSSNQMSNQQIIDSFVTLLYTVYGVSSGNDDLLIDGVVYDWSRDNLFVGGGYSSPKVRSKHIRAIKNPRATLGEPMTFVHSSNTSQCGQLIIAGEATSPTLCSTVQGALESGETAVKYLIKHIGHLQSKL